MTLDTLSSQRDFLSSRLLVLDTVRILFIMLRLILTTVSDSAVPYSSNRCCCQPFRCSMCYFKQTVGAFVFPLVLWRIPALLESAECGLAQSRQRAVPNPRVHHGIVLSLSRCRTSVLPHIHTCGADVALWSYGRIRLALPN